MKNKPRILVIVGPTAVGKSDMAVLLARKYDGEVVSADSRQVYRGMNIGSGKITTKEMKGVPHHLLDVADPKRTYTVARYQRDAQKAVFDILKRGKLPIICGGTGFYIDALVDGIVLPDVPPNTDLRKRLADKTTQELLKLLEKLDSKRAETIDKDNPRRLVRAIEIATALGSVPPVKKTSLFDPLFIGLTLPPEELKKNIEKRYDKRLKKGMVAEVKKLHEAGVSWKRLESFGLEYRFIAHFLQKKISKAEMREKIVTESVQYARRQMQWWKKNERIRWCGPKSLSQASEIVATFLK